jgi:hypothetical protein
LYITQLGADYQKKGKVTREKRKVRRDKGEGKGKKVERRKKSGALPTTCREIKKG